MSDKRIEELRSRASGCLGSVRMPDADALSAFAPDRAPESSFWRQIGPFTILHAACLCLRHWTESQI